MNIKCVIYWIVITPCSHHRIVGEWSFITSWGRGIQFSKRGKFENAQNVMGVKILRHRTGLLYKSCQTTLWLKQIHVSFKHRQKIRFDSSCQQQNIMHILKIVIAKARGGGEVLIHHTFLTNPHRKKRKDQNKKYIIKSEWQHIFKPFSPNSDQHEFSPNNVHMLSREMVMRIIQMITKEKMLCPFIKIPQLTVSLGNVWISVWRICSGYWGLTGKHAPRRFKIIPLPTLFEKEALL